VEEEMCGGISPDNSGYVALVHVQIALVRCQLDPLAVLSALCGPSAEILSMDLHPLKELLPRQALLTAAERICITAVNQASSCITLLNKHLWGGTLQQSVKANDFMPLQVLGALKRQQEGHTCAGVMAAPLLE
jgi:hypothetical protein